MPMKLISLEEFRAKLRDGAAPTDAGIQRLATGDVAEVTGKERTLRFCFSDETIDRSGDKIDQSGWDLKNFLANPVALWAHSYSAPPIGRASDVGVVGTRLMGDITFASVDEYAFADTIYRLVKGGYIRTVSVGFNPIEYSFVNEKDRPFGIDFKKQELLEISPCPVPCNPNALIAAAAKGIDMAPLREWASMVLDTGGANVIVPRGLLEETFRLAKTPRAVRQQYLAKSENEEWKVGATRDLPVDESGASWDGPAAAKRMLDEAGFDGDSPDADKAKRGFLIYDSANPTLRSSYKLPFADIVGGELKAVKGGVDAASQRLPQTDTPASVLDDANTVVSAYEERMKKSVKSNDAQPAGTCGRKSDEECGMKDPAECSVHRPNDKENSAPVEKAGRRISSANEAKLREAMDHHQAATKCIKDVLDSNATADPDDDDDDNNLEVQPADERAARLQEAKRLKASLQTAA